MADQRPTPDQEVRRLYEEAETNMARAAERLVSRDSFGEILALVTENAVALTRIGYESLDMLWTNLRLASKQDLLRLGRQLGRNEDKLEYVLQEVERLRMLVEARDNPPSDDERTANGGQRRRRTAPRSESP
jgi:hypothetical protein